MHFSKFPHTLVARRPAASTGASNLSPNKSNYSRITTSIYLLTIWQISLVRPIPSNNNMHYYPKHTEIPISICKHIQTPFTDLLSLLSQKNKISTTFQLLVLGEWSPSRWKITKEGTTSTNLWVLPLEKPEHSTAFTKYKVIGSTIKFTSSKWWKFCQLK